jgi:hypothetical protein
MKDRALFFARLASRSSMANARIDRLISYVAETVNFAERLIFAATLGDLIDIRAL